MMRITKFFMERRTLFWSVMAIMLLLGVVYYMRMPKLEDPAVTVKQASVVVVFPGADAERLERDAVTVLEDQLRTLPDVKKIKSDIRPGQALLTVEFQLNVLEEEVEQHFDQLRRKVSDASNQLPQGCMTPIVVDDMMDVYGLFYALVGDGYTRAETEHYAKLLRREILAVKGVKRVHIGGTQREVIDIAFTPGQIRRNGMLPMLVAQALQSSTKVVDAGKVADGSDRLSLALTDGAVTVAEIADIQLSMPGGKKVRIGDVASVSRHEAEPLTGDFYLGGTPALTILVALEKSAVVPDVGAAVDKVVERVLGRLPVGMTMEKVFFQPDKVDEAMSSFMLNLLESVLIVFVVILVAMGWRAGMIIGLGLVLTVALSFPILSFLGTTLQRISLGAFIVAMGMLVDNAVVIMDGIINDRKRGLRRDVYLYETGRKTALPLLGATVIAASTFMPIFLTPGTVGEFAGDLFLVICVSLMVSWILALIQVPVCADSWLGPSQVVEGEKVELKLNPLQKVVKRVVEVLMRKKWLTVGVAVAVLVVAGVSMKYVRNIFFPDFEYSQFVIECSFPAESNPDRIRDRMLSLSDTIEATDGVERVAVSMGNAPGMYCLVRPIISGGDEYAEFIIDCKDFKTVQRLSDELILKLRSLMPEAYIRARRYNLSVSSSHTVEVEFGGPDPDVLRGLSAQAEAIMKSCPYVDPYTVQNNWLGRRRNVTVDYSARSAAMAGVNRGDVGNALMAATDGYAVGVVNDNDRMIPINMVIRDDAGERLQDFSALPVWCMMNLNLSPDDAAGIMNGSVTTDDVSRRMFGTTLLGSCVDSIYASFTEGRIFRLNGRRVIEAECEPIYADKNATPAKVMEYISPLIDAIPLPDGYTMRYVGEGETSGEAMGDVFSFMPLMIIILVVVLLALFNDWRKLAVILLCFPFVMCGIVPALLITDTPFTFLAILGFMGLIGMMIKNAIVLVDEIDRLNRQEKVELYPAIVRATLSRVTPVMLASFTTIAGMIPLVSDPMYGSLAVTIIGGLFVGTLVTLLFLPVLYSLFFRVDTSKK